ncbi:DNA utilization protein HofM [Salmonella enterica subsp. enterica]|uniref:DNA utilization protein HofM n=1 Tax=Salmonella enterica I TaxID=59201 RepID=A0A3S5DMD2_SALET|nr:DNA utilization protein HofM [Salmonella enterica subsp. enterica]
MNASTAEGTIPDPQSLAHVLRPLEPRAAATSPYLSLFSRKIGHLQRAFPHPPMRLREREASRMAFTNDGA